MTDLTVGGTCFYDHVADNPSCVIEVELVHFSQVTHRWP